MNKAAAYLLEVKDFGAFCKAGSDVKTTLCDVTEAHWQMLEEGNYDQEEMACGCVGVYAYVRDNRLRRVG